MNLNLDLAVAECRGDFWLKLEDAMAQAGGGFRIEIIADMPLREIVDVLAQNGIRMTYKPEWVVRD